jgi:hypothetical protein
MNNEKKQTAVEWLEELIECGADFEQIKKCLPKAKEMEKEQIEDAYEIAFDDGFDDGKYNNESKYQDGKDYYRKTYGGDK